MFENVQKSRKVPKFDGYVTLQTLRTRFLNWKKKKIEAAILKWKKSLNSEINPEKP